MTDRDGLTETQKFGHMPSTLRYIMIFIDRIGFPILAFCIMSYICFVTLNKLTDALTENTRVLSVIDNGIKYHQKWTEEAVDRLEKK